MTLSLEGLRAALAYQNVFAWLHTIEEGEIPKQYRHTPDAYRVLFGGELVDDLSKHPNRKVTRGSLTSTAAGRFQALYGTWCDFARDMSDESLPFSPDNQDLFGVWCTRRRGALQAVISGNLEVAVRLCAKEWASFPGSPYGQPTVTMADLRATFVRFGGTLADDLADRKDAPAPIEERGRDAEPTGAKEMAEESSWTWGDVAKVGGGIASIFNPLVGAAIMALSPLLQQKITQEVGRHTDPETAKQVAANLSNVIEKVVTRETKESDPFKAVLALQKDPAVVAKVEAALVSRLDEMAPFLDKLHSQSVAEWDAEEGSRDRAAARVAADPAQSGQIQLAILKYTLWLMAGVLVYVGALIGFQMWLSKGEEPNGQLLILFVMLATMCANVYRSIADWGYGSSKSSAAKDITMAELSRRK